MVALYFRRIRFRLGVTDFQGFVIHSLALSPPPPFIFPFFPNHHQKGLHRNGSILGIQKGF